MNHKQIYIFSESFKSELIEEVKRLDLKILETTEQMLVIENGKLEPAWAQCVWNDVQTIDFISIADAQKKLKAISKKWNYYGELFFRRGKLISETLEAKNQKKEIEFIVEEGDKKISYPVFTMAGQNSIYYSERLSRPTVDGKIFFSENKLEPPSRAYLKLWEALTLLGDYPKKNERVIDLGSAPGSWTWVLAELEAKVHSIDRSQLDLDLNKYKNIKFEARDVFELKPEKVDWLFSDVICYPDRLFQYVSKWMDSGFCKKFVCTLKFKGKPDYEVIECFRKLPHSRVVHLYHNKNEVTWISHPSL